MVIIPQFDKYPLLTQKRADFLLFKSIVKMISVPSGESKEHLNHNDLQEIVKIQASMNSGAVRSSEKLTERFRALFPNEVSGCPHEGYSSALCEGKKTKPVPSPEVQFTGIPDSHWLAGFTDAEGCFMIKIQQSTSSTLNTQPRLIFRITQHSRDLELMKSLVEYFDCGYYYPDSNLDHGDFVVTKFSDICAKKSLRDGWLRPALSLAFASAERGMKKFKDALLASLEKNNIFTIYYFFPLSISLNLNLLFKYLIKYLNYDKFLEDLLRYFFKSEFENFSNILGEFFKTDAHLFLNYFLYIVN